MFNKVLVKVVMRPQLGEGLDDVGEFFLFDIYSTFDSIVLNSRSSMFLIASSKIVSAIFL